MDFEQIKFDVKRSAEDIQNALPTKENLEKSALGLFAAAKEKMIVLKKKIVG
jgi:hypothetical protein